MRYRRGWLALVLLLAVAPLWAVSPGLGVGVLGEYFDNADFTGKTVTRMDAGVNYDWPAGAAPAAGMAPTDFSVRWRGFVQPRFNETYTFTTLASGGVRLRINGRLLVNNWPLHAAKEDSGTIALQAGKLCELVLETTQKSVPATVRLFWSSASQPKEIIPARWLYPAGLRAATLLYADAPDLRTGAIWSMSVMSGETKRLGAAGDGEPYTSADGAKIVFTSSRNATWADPKVLKKIDIYLMEADGTNVRRLTKTGENRQPCISADGKRIAYAANIGTGWNIWTANTSGLKALQLTHETEAACPTLSPDGAQVAYQATRGGKTNIYLRSTNGDEDEVALTTEGGTHPVFNPKGDKIAFISTRDGNAELYLMASDGTQQTRLTNSLAEDSHPAFSTDGKQIVFTEKTGVGRSDLFLLPLESGLPMQITNTGRCYAPAFVRGGYQLPPENLVLWLSAAHPESVVRNEAGKVSRWVDLSGRGHDAVNDTPATQPEIRPTGLAGQPALFFNNSILNIPDLSDGWVNKEATLFVLFMPDNADRYTILHQNNGLVDEWWRYPGDGFGYLTLFRSSRLERTPENMPTNDPTLFTIVSGATAYIIFRNGTAVTTATPNFLIPTTLLLGNGGGAGGLRGHIAEVAIYNIAVSDTQRRAIEALFRARYGL